LIIVFSSVSVARSQKPGEASPPGGTYSNRLTSYKPEEILKSTPIVVILQNLGGVDPTRGAPAFTSN